MENQQTPVFINLLAIARYDQMPDYPIQFMTTGKLYYKNPGEALLQYVESQEDEETGEITRADISLSLSDGKVTMQRSGDFSNTMVFSSGKRFEGTYHTPYGEMDMAVFTGLCFNGMVFAISGVRHVNKQLKKVAFSIFSRWNAPRVSFYFITCNTFLTTS